MLWSSNLVQPRLSRVVRRRLADGMWPYLATLLGLSNLTRKVLDWCDSDTVIDSAGAEINRFMHDLCRKGS